MAWQYGDGATFTYSFEGDDKDLVTLSNYVGVVAVSRQTSRVNTGAGGGDFDLTTNGNRAVLKASSSVTSGAAQLNAFQGFFGLDTAPTSEMALLYGSTTSTGASGGRKYITIGTDRKVRCYDKNANLLATSTTLIPTSGLQEITVFFNAITLSTVWITVCFGGTEELSFNTGLSRANFFTSGEQIFWGEALDAGVNRGCHLYADDLTSRLSQTAGDAPHLVAYPRFRAYGAVNPTTLGNYSAWDSNDGDTITHTTTTVSYLDNSQLPTHNGDTKTIASSVEDEKWTMKSTVANPLPDPFTVDYVVVEFVERLTGGGKFAPFALLRLAGVDDALGLGLVSSTSFVGSQTTTEVAPGGGAWVRANADASTLEWGQQAFSTDAGSRTTLMLGPIWVGHTASLSLTTTPVAAIANLVLSTIAGVASLNALGLVTRPLMTLNPVAGIASLNALGLVTRPLLALSTVVGESTTVATVFTFAQLALSTVAGVASLNALGLVTRPLLSLSTATGIASLNALGLVTRPLLTLSTIAGIASLDPLGLVTRPFLALSTIAGIASLNALGLVTRPFLALSTVTGSATATSSVTSFVQLSLSTVAGVASLNTLGLVTRPLLALSTVAGSATATTSVITIAQLVLSTIAGVASLNALGLVTRPLMTLNPVAGIASLDILDLLIRPLLALSPVAGEATASLGLTTRPLLTFVDAAGVAVATLSQLVTRPFLSLSQVDGIALPLMTIEANPGGVLLSIVDGIAAASLTNLVTRPLLALSTVAGSATATTAITSAVQLALSTVAGIASLDALGLVTRPLLALSTVAGDSSLNALGLVTRPLLALSPVAGVATATTAVFTFAQLALSTVNGAASLNTLGLVTRPLLTLSPVVGSSVSTLSFVISAILQLSQVNGVATAAASLLGSLSGLIGRRRRQKP